ncbi:MAG: hypothetical protein HOW73_40770 [Polyangiaceae bacterium]|nr:hypothetical protein [Polyangiaceae bacterium]
MRLTVAIIAAALLAGCSDDDPAASGPGGTGGDPTGNPPPSTPEIPGLQAKTRTVIERNPFGNVAATQNLLWDGDFEWTSPFTDQYGWIEPPTNPVLSDVVTGPACKSGVKCARVKNNRQIIGIGVGSATQPLDASVWVRFEVPEGEEAPTCADAESYVMDVGMMDEVDEDFALLPTSEMPDETGWCKLAASVPVRKNKPYLVVANRSKVTMLVDDAVVLARKAPSALPPAKPLSERAPSADTTQMLARARAAIAATRRPSDGAPNAAREAFQRSRRGRGEP